MYKKLILLILFGAVVTTSCCALAEDTVFETPPSEEIPAVEKKEVQDSKTQLEIINQIQESIKVGKPIEFNGGPSPKTVEGSVEKNRVMSVEECIQLALLNNPTIQAAIADKEIYKTKIGQAWSAYFPTLNLGASYDRNKVIMGGLGTIPSYSMYNVPSVGFNQLVYDFGKTRSATNIAKKTFEASDQNLSETVNSVIYNVKEAYYDLLYAVRQVQVYEDTVANYEAHLEQAKNYYLIGTKAKIDVITAEYNLGNAKLSLIKAKHEIDASYAKLNNAMGVPEYANYSVDESFETPQYNFEFDKLIEKAYETRPELLAAQKKAEASNILIKASKFAFMPDLRLYGSYVLGGQTMGNTTGYQLGGALQYGATNIWLLKKQVDEAKATYKRDSAQYEEAKQAVYLEVKSAFINFNNAKESIPVAKLALLNAKEQHDLASGRYKTGLGDAIELKDAETTYLSAQLQYFNTLLSYNVALANLEKVIGTSVMRN